MARRNPKTSGSPTSDESTDSSRSVELQPLKKRKHTYLVRKEEEEELRDEILQLQAQVAVLQTQGMPAGSALAADPGLQQVKAKSKVLADAVKQQQLRFAAAQSLMMKCTRTQYSNPLCTRIHLKKDWGERRATLLAIRAEKLQNAYEYVMTRFSQNPNEQGQESSELFETDSGDVSTLVCTVILFPGVQALRQVFDALWFYLTNMEISISEQLGHITVREDYDVIEGSAYNARIVSSDDNGITKESNTVVFVQFFEHGNPRFGGVPCAVVASDYVDEDELYPYRSSEHIQKDIAGAVVLTASRQKKQLPSLDGGAGGTSEDNEELVVTMRRIGYLKLHRPGFPLPPIAQQELQAGIGEWGQVMVKAIREILYARA